VERFTDLRTKRAVKSADLLLICSIVRLKLKHLVMRVIGRTTDQPGIGYLR
jgi:hypothetical protein